MYRFHTNIKIAHYFIIKIRVFAVFCFWHSDCTYRAESLYEIQNNSGNENEKSSGSNSQKKYS